MFIFVNNYKQTLTFTFQLNKYEEKLFDDILNQLQQKDLNKLTINNVIQTWKCLGVAGHFDEEFLNQCQIYLLENIDTVQLKQIPEIFYLLSKFRVVNNDFLNQIVDKFFNELGADSEISYGDLTHIIWSFNVLNIRREEQQLLMLINRFKSAQASDFSSKQLNTLYQIRLFCQTNNQRDYLWDNLDQQVIVAAESQWKQFQAQRAKENVELVDNIFPQVNLFLPETTSFNFQKEINNGDFVLDISLEDKQKQIAVMFTGQQCYSQNCNQQVTVGFQYMNDDILGKLGWTVINLKQSEQDKVEYLKSRLQQLGIIQG
eukprot:TRINITY_DN26740_c1_g1_i8.p1 TRINITY_DN26740_c1_g1~~TRINITY_DN26740_c1_g1_i8.p1  ORF type:complete len:317 (-),score=29.92 TRINITY_DN26740_c1_g1_i8:47-997(-)